MASPLLLCVDDWPQLLHIRKAALESFGYSVATASNQHAAIKIMEEMPVDVVLLEYKTEGMDAQAVAFHIKRRFPAVPIILLSACAEMPEAILWLVDEYVLKSERMEELARAVERVMQSAKSRKFG